MFYQILFPCQLPGPKYDPEAGLARLGSGQAVCDESTTVRTSGKDSFHIMKTTMKSLYLMVGRELRELESVPAGNVVGLGGLEEFILKSATVSSSVACPPFVEITQSAQPILR